VRIGAEMRNALNGTAPSIHQSHRASARSMVSPSSGM
jgi:hypothetical protein